LAKKKPIKPVTVLATVLETKSVEIYPHDCLRGLWASAREMYDIPGGDHVWINDKGKWESWNRSGFNVEHRRATGVEIELYRAVEALRKHILGERNDQ
jgi:hypothetical protein